jgi:hypothetical protein
MINRRGATPKIGAPEDNGKIRTGNECNQCEKTATGKKSSPFQEGNCTFQYKACKGIREKTKFVAIKIKGAMFPWHHLLIF